MSVRFHSVFPYKALKTLAIASVPLVVFAFANRAGAQGEPGGDKPPSPEGSASTPPPAPTPSTVPTVPPAPPPVEPPPPVVNETPHNVSPEATVANSIGKTNDFMDTRLTWTFGDDDLLHRTGSTQPLSPLPNIGDRPQYKLFFDSLNSRDAGRENVTQLVLYKKMPGFITNLTTDAAFVLRFDGAALAAKTGNVDPVLYDAGSFLRIFYRTGKEKEGLGLVFYPLDTDRFRLGYLYDISWGGTNPLRNESIFPFPNTAPGSSPGLKMQYDGANGFYMFGGFKVAQLTQAQTILRPGTSGGNDVETVRVKETNYGFLGGIGSDLGSLVHVDLGGGYFQQGRFEFPDLRPPPDTDKQAPRVFTYGVSARIVLHDGIATPQSSDFLLYRNDPNAPMLMFKPEVYKRDEFSWSLAVEGTQLSQNLHDPDPNKVGATKLQAARAAAVQGTVKAGYTRLGLVAIYRDLPFILRNVPGFVPFEAIDPEAKTQSELFFAGSVDYYIESAHLRPGIGGGVQFPATFSTSRAEGNADINHTVVIRKQGSIAILPEDVARKPIIQARVSLKWDLSTIMSAIGWVQLVHDPNATLLTRDPAEGTVGIRTFQASDFFGFGMTLQARY